MMPSISISDATLITAYDAPGLREEAMRRGAAAYLVKPFRGTALQGQALLAGLGDFPER